MASQKFSIKSYPYQEALRNQCVYGLMLVIVSYRGSWRNFILPMLGANYAWGMIRTFVVPLLTSSMIRAKDSWFDVQQIRVRTNFTQRDVFRVYKSNASHSVSWSVGYYCFPLFRWVAHKPLSCYLQLFRVKSPTYYLKSSHFEVYFLNV